MVEEKQKPNIIWFMIDSFRRYLLLPSEYCLEKTFIDKLTEKGVFFEQCVTAAPYTLASMNAMLTGFYPSVNRLDGWFKITPDDLDKKIVTFADILKSEGYFNSAFFPKRARALIPPYSFDHFQLVKGPDEFSFERYIVAPSPKLAIFYLEEVHDTCCGNAGKFDAQKYFESVKEVAERVRYFYEKCAKENDIIVITSDHGVRITGEPTNDIHRDEMVAGKFLTDKTTRTFFSLVYQDKLESGKIVKEQMRTIDIAPTVLDLAGLPVLRGQGVSLFPYLKGEKKWQEQPAFIVTGGSETSPWKPDMWAIRTPKWKFILTKSKKNFFQTVDNYELYNLVEDPAELNNVVDRFSEIANEFLKKIKENLLYNMKKVEEYYQENNFNYETYLKTRIFPLWLKFDLFLRTLICKLFIHPKIQLGVGRIKIRKFLIKKFGKSII